MPTDTRPHQNEKQPGPRPQLPLRRLFLLTVLTAALAFALQAILAVTGAPAGEALIRLAIPLAAAAVIFFGLRPYPTAGRTRLAVMVGVALFLLGLAL